MFTKDRIEELLELYKTSDNYMGFKQDPYNGRPLLKRDLVEAKMYVDRWGTCVTDWVFHPSQKENLESLFPEEESPTVAVKEALQILLKYAHALELNKKVDELTEEDLAALKKKKPFSFWGGDVHYSEFIAPNQAMGVSLNSQSGALMGNDSEKITNSIIVFDLP